MADGPAQQYVVIRGGMAVTTSDDVTVLDCDVLDDYDATPGLQEAQRQEVESLRDRARTHGLDDLAQECDDWLDDHGFEPEVKVDVAAPKHEPEW